MNQFNVDWQTLVKLLTPSLIRKDRLLALLMALVSPVQYLYSLFTGNRNKNLYRLSHNGQVCKLQAVLNDQFDNVLRRIYIIDGPDIDSTYIYLQAELKTRFIYKQSEPSHTYIRLQSEIGSTADFIVKVPVGLTYDVTLMRALINDYRLASKSNYLITT